MTDSGLVTRRGFLRAAGMSTAAVMLGRGLAGAAGVSDKRRPNIIFIMSDDHASHAIGAYGSRINRTPHIDRIAREGMRFDNCFCTNSICAPSRAVILTGKYSHLNGIIHNGITFDGGQETYPKVLRQAGYQTAMIGKWHLDSDPTGFDYWEVLPGQGSYYNPDFIQMDGSRKRYTGYCPDLIADFSIDWLTNRRDQDKPFLLISQHKSPHRPWSPPPRHLGTYKHGTIPEPETLFADHSTRCAASRESEMSIRDHFSWSHDMKFKGENLFPEHFTSSMQHWEYNRMTAEEKRAWDEHYEPENQAFIEQMQAGRLSEKDIVRWKYQRYMHDYLGSVAAMDEAVGRLLDYLDESGLAENTIVVYTSDQGFYLGDQGWYDKRFMYETSLRMPLLVRWPGRVKAGSVNEDIVLNLDFAETFLEAAGAAVPAAMQGQSLLPLLGGQTPGDWRDAMYYHYYEFPGIHQVKRHYGIRTRRYKLIHFYRDIDCWELYDVQADPQELNNLYGKREYAQLTAELKGRLRELQARYRDVEGLEISG